MFTLMASLALAVSASATTADDLKIASPLSDAEIEEAIALGSDLSKKLPRLFLGAAGSDFGGARSDSNRNNSSLMEHQKSVKTSGFGVEVYTPYAWIARLSRNAAKKGRQMLPSHLNETHLEPVLRVVCHSDVPQDFHEGAYGTAVARATLQSANKKVTDALEPLATTRIPDKIRVPSGELIDIGPLLASFDLGQLQLLSSRDKKGEFFVTIEGDNGETKKFKVKSKHFKQLP